MEYHPFCGISAQNEEFEFNFDKHKLKASYKVMGPYSSNISRLWQTRKDRIPHWRRLRKHDN